MSFINKVVLVTGSGSGIGQATTEFFAKEGADVVIVDNDEEKANETAEKCKEYGNRVLVIKTDVTKNEEAKNCIDKTVTELGKLDILVNNAGIIREGNLISGTVMNSYDDLMNTNLRSVVLMTSFATPALISSKGCIVNISSMVSMDILKGRKYPIYTMSKVALDCFTRLSAAELAPIGIRVNAVNPGPVFTNLLANAGLPCNFNLETKLPGLGNIMKSLEVAELIAFLASDKARNITGSNYMIDNGKSLL